MKAFENSRWLWIDDNSADAYVDFLIEYDFDGEQTTLLASVDGYMSLKVNGVCVSVTQYPDFPFYKSFESVDLTSFSKIGKNTAVLTVWHIGTEHLTTYPAPAGAIFEVWRGEKLLLASDSNISCRRTPGYKYGQCKSITSQLGLSFDFDACDSGEPYAKRAVVVDKKASFVKRPIKPLAVSDAVSGELVTKTGENTYLYDFGKEIVGFVRLVLHSKDQQSITVTWSEHLVDNHARRKVGGRDFSFFYHTKEGENVFENRLLRFGLRYMELYCEKQIDVRSVEILPVNYPVNVLPYKSSSMLIQRIYDTCVHTLRCCMHEHYEDCPWREQALYSLDSRNQMLAGYIAFKEYDYAEKNLLLLAKGIDENGFLPLCAPTSKTLPIPSFSLAYLWSVDEFETYSGRLADKDIFNAANSIIKAFNKRLDMSENGLINELEEPFWNFYEWSPNCDRLSPGTTTSLLNMMYLCAFERYTRICERHKAEPIMPKTDFESLRSLININFRRKDGTYRLKRQRNEVSMTDYVEVGDDFTNDLVNSFAILSGVCTDKEAQDLAKLMMNTDTNQTTLSMKGFYYDALCKADSKNAEYVMADICKNYAYMLDSGATTFWETILGAEDFRFAGSLCHGWSALPIYYISKFQK